MQWLELSIEAPGELAEPLAHLFSRHGEGGVAIELPGGYNPDEGETGPAPGSPVTVRGYLPLDATTRSRRAMIDIGVRLVAHIRPLPPIRERTISEDEWRDQKFEPVRVGRRLLVAPPDAISDASSTDVVIPLEPGLAFGTGHHPTTMMCLKALEDHMQPGAAVLDLGSGSGILSIAALKLGAQSVTCFDIDPDAVRSTNRNLELAGVGDHARVVQGTVPHHAVPPGSFDVAVANISANVLIELAVPLLEALKPRGLAVASGVLEGRLDDVRAAFVTAGGVIEAVETTDDWVMLLVRKP